MRGAHIELILKVNVYGVRLGLAVKGPRVTALLLT